MSDNHYDILGVPKDADQKAIKTAYRNLAKKHHPDKGGDEELFKKISEAYDTLGDEEKRAQYDNPRPTGGFGDFDVSDFFNQFRQAERRATPKVAANIRIQVDVTLEEVFSGKDVSIGYTRASMCNTCDGEGGDTPTNCSACGGSGHNDVQQGNVIMRSICNVCSGTGTRYANKCKDCSDGYKSEDNTIKITLPPSTIDGEKVGVQGGGNEIRKGIFGDMIVVVRHIIHNVFIYDRENRFNLLQALELTYPEMVLGCEKVVSEIGGKKLKIVVPPLTGDGDELRVKGKGLKLKYINNRTGEKTTSDDRGDMFVIPTLVMPTEVSDEEKALLNQLKDIKQKV